MKRFLALFLSIILAISFTACGAQEKTSGNSDPSNKATPTEQSKKYSAEKINIKIAALKGPTAMGMVKLMEDANDNNAVNNYTFTLVGAPDEITGNLIKGDFDIAAVPTNLAAVLYNKTKGKIKLAALNTLGILYIVENGNTIKRISDLKGKTIYSTGKGATPEFALNYILEQNGLNVNSDVNVEYKSEHSELATLLAADEASIAVLPQPFVTSVLNQNKNLRIALDLTEEWTKKSSDSMLTMGCLVVNNEFAKKNAEAMNSFLEEYKKSVDFVNNSENIEDSAKLVEKYGIIKAEIAKTAIPQCNIVFIDGADMKKSASGFLNVLYKADAKSVGGKLPDESFYYEQ